MRNGQRVTIEDGILKIDGQPKFVWSADYPYYRDERADWAKQLDNLKKMNVNVVTFYIPWRHHAPIDPLHGDGIYDFRGELNDRTDVLEFIRLIHERGMYCIAKPGPYIHAETRFGSLPDYVLPENNPDIALRVDMQGDAASACWGFSNPPAPMDPRYLQYVEEWFHIVAREVIKPNEYPNGPILAVQVLNEGIYSDGGYGVDQIHFDEPAVNHYREFVEKKYGTIEKYNNCCGTELTSFKHITAPKQWTSHEERGALLPWINWAEFGQYFYRKIASTYVEYLRAEEVSLPMVLNINPPARECGATLETVMGRYTVPYLNPVINYGYTNWCGVVSHHEESYLKYKIVAKSARGINMEENWGFDSYDPPYYWSVQPSYFQSLAYMLWGATGLNIYLGVSCDCWTDDLAPDAGGVYMHNHPIAEDGTYRDSFWTCHQLGALMKHIGNDLVSQELYEPVTWGLYSPYAHAASWDSAPRDWTRIGFPDRPRAAWFGWDSFMALCEKNKTQNGVCYPREESIEQLSRRPIIFMDGNRWMDVETQRKLVDYVERGGVLVMTTFVPDLDEFFQPCTILRDALFPCDLELVSNDGDFEYTVSGGDFKGRGRGALRRVSSLSDDISVVASALTSDGAISCGAMSSKGDGKAVLLGFSPWQTESGEWGSAGLIEHLARQYAGIELTSTNAPSPREHLVETAEFPCDERGRRYFYLLTRKDKPELYEVSTLDREGKAGSFKMQLPSYSGALVGFEDDKIVAAHIKGYNDLDKSTACPYLEIGKEVLEAADACDLYFCKTDNAAYELSVTNVQTDDHSTRVTLPLEISSVKRIVRVLNDGLEEEVSIEDMDGRLVFTALDMREGTSWSPWYRIMTNDE